MSSFDSLRWLVGHDPCRVGDRTPGGAVVPGQDVRVLFRVDAAVRGLLASVDLLVCERSTSGLEVSQQRCALQPCAVGFEGRVPLSGEPHVAFYAFELSVAGDGAEGELLYYVPRADGAATAGELVRPSVDGWWDAGWHYAGDRLAQRPAGAFGLEAPLPGFQVTVYEAAFSTPAWMSGAVMYQIFPDRFARGSAGVRAEGLAYRERMGRPTRFHAGWDEPVEWMGAVGAGGAGGSGDDGDAGADAADAEPTLAQRMAAYDPIDFYGGTLQGIRQYIAYLASLGVEVLYLNPVFEARSNHRYDTADYEHIDPLLGTDDDFRELAESASAAGISIVLDAVLSHTGDDSRYFNAYGTYGEAGAVQGEGSAFYHWYDFSDDEGVGYRSWWGFPSLPEVDERDPSWQSYILGMSRDGEVAPSGGVLQKWLAAGARGYRLDVADEIPDDVLSMLRTSVKAANPDAAIIGEVWEDATTKTSYGKHRDYALGVSLDSVMNYPLRSALIGFALGVVGARQLASFLKLQQASYPPPLYRCLMNLLSSHDVERLRSVLAYGGPLKHLPRDEQLAAVQAIAPDQDRRAARLQRMIVGLLYALPGMPCIYYGDECGLQGAGDPFCRASFPPVSGSARERDDCGEDLTAFYRNVGTLRKESRVLRDGTFSCVATGDDVLCVVREAPARQGRDGQAPVPGEIFVAVANRSDRGQGVALDLMAPDVALSDGARAEILRQAGSSPFLSCEGGIALLTVAPCATRYLSWKF